LSIISSLVVGAALTDDSIRLNGKYEDQIGRLVATLAGAVLGIVTGGSLEHGWFIMVIWALSAVIVGGLVYCLRVSSQ
jgi:hypothetical protein